MTTAVSPNPGTLTWPGTQHSLEFRKRETGLLATMNVVKPNGTQKIEFDLPPNVSLDHVLRAWELQGKKWEDVYVLQGAPVFIAVRVIRLDPYGGIFWFVHHVDNTPDDRCFFTPIGTSIR